MPTPIVEHRLPGGLRLVLSQGDLTEADLEAIVNAANPRLQHGGGVAAAIVRRGGAVIQRQSDDWVLHHGPASNERPAVTEGGRLLAKHVIHVVGPVWGEGQEDRKLRLAATSALQAAWDLGVASVGLPAISTGIFGFPVDRAAPILLSAIADFAASHPDGSLRHVELVLFDTQTVETFRTALELSPK